MTRFTSAVVIFFSLFIAVSAQDTSPTPPPLDDGEVVKITTTLIQLDAVVTDKKGRQVTDLTIDDFEIFENGKKQIISNFTYISIPRTNISTDDSSQNSGDRNSKNSVVVPGTSLKPEQVRRTYAIVVDDLGISFENFPDMKRAIRKFVIEQVQQGDLVAIVKTGGGSGALQSFTSDKRQLLAAIEKIRWNSVGRGGISSFEKIEISLKEDLAGTINSSGGVSTPAGIDDENAFEQRVADDRRASFEAGTLSSLRYVIAGMSELPGRKSVILYSEGFSSVRTGGDIEQATGIFQKLRDVADFANRASVVFYTIDPRGLVNPGMIMAQDNVREVVPTSAASDGSPKRQARESSFRDSQQTLRYLAYETGGLPFVNNNSMSKGLDQAMEDQSGYYLIAYIPDEETFDRTKNRYNDIKIKLKTDGMNLRTRNGFYAYASDTVKPPKATAGQQIYRALLSPFAANDIELSLNTLFGFDEKDGKFLQSLVYIDGRGLTFTKEQDGNYKANFDIVAVTFGADQRSADEISRNYSVKVNEESYKRLLETGFVYKLNIPVKKSGGYQFRVAVRDSVSEKVGSASQFISVPNLDKKKLSLSSIVLNRYSQEEWLAIRQKEPGSSNEASYDNSIDNALRVFESGDVLQFGYVVYNPKSGRDYTLRTRLIKDGRVILEGDPSSMDRPAAQQKSVEVSGAITIGKNLKPGDYVLQIIVGEQKNKKTKNTVTQWLEFEVGG